MPHNKTRAWVGLAIVAVTIPAVGTYYYGSATHDLRGQPISAAGRSDLQSRRYETIDTGPKGLTLARDYGSEVKALLARNGEPEAPPEPVYDEDEFFDVGPIDESAMQDAPVAEVPDPAMDLTPNDAPAVADASGGVAEVPLAMEASATVDAQSVAGANLSDASIYRMVVGNLPADQRDEFVRAYAIMTPDQRADLIDEFRQQIESGPQ